VGVGAQSNWRQDIFARNICIENQNAIFLNIILPIPEKYTFSRFFFGGGGLAAPISYAYRYAGCDFSKTKSPIFMKFGTLLLCSASAAAPNFTRPMPIINSPTRKSRIRGSREF